MKNYIFTGVGSRKTPVNVGNLMTKLSSRLASHGMTLRTGDAHGADCYFRKGSVMTLSEVYSANNAVGDKRAFDMAKLLHPAWDRCSDYAKLLHSRNCYQVLGLELNKPSDFLICWTPNGSETLEDLKRYGASEGGTSTAIRLANVNNIPVFNLQRGTTSLYKFILDNYDFHK